MSALLKVAAAAGAAYGAMRLLTRWALAHADDEPAGPVTRAEMRAARRPS